MARPSTVRAAYHATVLARIAPPLLILLAACGPSQEVHSGRAMVVVSAVASSRVPAPTVSTSASAREVGTPLPPALRAPKNVVCRLRTKKLFSQFNWILRLKPGGAEGVTVNGGIPATLHLPAGDALVGAFLEAANERATLNGWLNTGGVRLSAARAILLAGYFVPYTWTALTWQPSAAPSKRVRVATPEDADVRGASSVATELDCDQLTIGADTRFDPQDGLPEPVGKTYGKLATNAVPLSHKPGSDAVATIARQGAGVWIHRSEGSNTLITYPGHHGLMFGWVDSAHVTPTPDSSAGFGHGVSWGSSGGRSLRFPTHLTCSEPLPIVLEIGDERATIGHFTAGESIQVTHGRPSPGGPTPPGPFRQVRLKGQRWFRLATNAELLARTADVATCTP